VEQTHREIADHHHNAKIASSGRVCACGCGAAMPADYSERLPADYSERFAYLRGHKPKTTALAKTSPAKPIKTRTARREHLSLAGALQNLRGLLDCQKQEIDRNLAAVETVIELVHRVDESASAAEFMHKRA